MASKARKAALTYTASAAAGYVTWWLWHTRKALVIRTVLRGGTAAYRLTVKNGAIRLPPRNNIIMETTVIGATEAGIYIGPEDDDDA